MLSLRTFTSRTFVTHLCRALDATAATVATACPNRIAQCSLLLNKSPLLSSSSVACLTTSRRSFADAPSSGVPSLGGKVKKAAAAGAMTRGPIAERKRIPVETDPVKLVTYCCGANINKTGEQPMLKPDDEYPDWLWTLRTTLPPPLEETDPNTLTYWRRYRTAAKRHNNRVRLTRPFFPVKKYYK